MTAAGKDRVYQGIGRFFVEFSALQAEMWTGIINLTGRGLGEHGPRSNTAWRIGLADLSAQTITNLYFALHSALTDLTADEQKIRNNLSGRIQDLITIRNDLAHGIWLVTITDGEETPDDQVFVMHDKLAAYEGVSQSRSRDYTAATLEELADKAQSLRRLVTAFSSKSHPSDSGLPLMTDRIKLDGKTVVLHDLTGWTRSTSDEGSG